ncbi:hypothetical protein BCR34DRAFT_363143 [Clohesyomyces aquaticus]|uniref:Secreted protein n=1 Tax=Clohesyomyces aquaticus TaxID=1231657 RepID=A0A1Y1ZIP5_9PLEO|nr:hypothetical protein BCR34DRAFT_363143 [Clohesyomyces aquaticus]
MGIKSQHAWSFLLQTSRFLFALRTRALQLLSTLHKTCTVLRRIRECWRRSQGHLMSSEFKSPRNTRLPRCLPDASF